MEIRNLEKSDINECIEIFKLNQPTEGWLDYPENRLIQEIEASFLDNHFCKPEYFVSIMDEKVVGFAGFGQLGFDDGVYGLFWIQVHPLYQKIGIGKKLTEIRINKIKKLNGELIIATTKKIWHLERFGFQQVSPRGDGYYLMQMMLDRN